MKQLTKDELIKKVAELELETKDVLTRDELIRKNICKFLGLLKTAKGMFSYNQEPEIRVVQWSEIYFEFGKLKQQNWRIEELKRIDDRLNYLMEEDKKAKETTSLVG